MSDEHQIKLEFRFDDGTEIGAELPSIGLAYWYDRLLEADGLDAGISPYYGDLIGYALDHCQREWNHRPDVVLIKAPTLPAKKSPWQEATAAIEAGDSECLAYERTCLTILEWLHEHGDIVAFRYKDTALLTDSLKDNQVMTVSNVSENHVADNVKLLQVIAIGNDELFLIRHRGVERVSIRGQQEIARLDCSVRCAVWCSQQERLAIAGDQILVWDGAAGQKLLTYPDFVTNTNWTSIDMSPDGDLVLACNKTEQILSWRISRQEVYGNGLSTMEDVNDYNDYYDDDDGNYIEIEDKEWLADEERWHDCAHVRINESGEYVIVATDELFGLLTTDTGLHLDQVSANYASEMPVYTRIDGIACGDQWYAHRGERWTNSIRSRLAVVEEPGEPGQTASGTKAASRGFETERVVGRRLLPQGRPARTLESTEQGLRCGSSGLLDPRRGMVRGPHPDAVCQDTGRASSGHSGLVRLSNLDRPAGRNQQQDQDHETPSLRIPRPQILQTKNPRDSHSQVRFSRMNHYFEIWLASCWLTVR
jgi:hypothetical protein